MTVEIQFSIIMTAEDIINSIMNHVVKLKRLGGETFV